MKRKNILFIARWYPDRHDSMYGLFVQKHAQAVQTLNDVTVLYVSADVNLQPGKVIITKEYFEGIFEIKIYFGKYKSEIRNAIAFFNMYKTGVRAAAENNGKPDLVHIHILSRTALPALLLKFTQGIPYIITEHWSRYLPVNVIKKAYTGWLRKLFTKIAVRNAAAVTTVTQNLADAMQTLGLRNTFFVTPNVADTNLFRLSENSRSEKIKKLLHVSCFDEPAKNVKGIINVIVQVAKNRTDFKIDLVGNGKDFEEVKSYAEATGLVNKIIFFTGLLTGEELATKMRDAEAMVMFSNYENLPCTIVESICSGVPVISTDVGGIKEFLLPDMGILIKPNQESELKNAILEILNNSRLFNKDKIRKFGLEKFSLISSGKLFNEIYNNTLKTN